MTIQEHELRPAVPRADARDYWRIRAEQLQYALDSRVVIEQAKGMLAERFALPIDAAFELLRSAARRERMKLHELAAEVVTSPTTPAPIREQLRRL